MRFALHEINTIALDIIKQVENQRHADRATVVCLQGDLGAGKTTLVQAIARQLGIGHDIPSPTFVILKNYSIPERSGSDTARSFAHMVHIDAYRLNSSDDMMRLDWMSYVNDPGNLIIIEWPSIIADIIPDDAIRITLGHVSDTERDISID